MSLPPLSYRCWDTESRRYRESFPAVESYIDNDVWDDPEEHWEDTLIVDPAHPLPTFGGRMVYEPNTGLRDKDERPVFAGDIVAFTIRGAAHGREVDHCANAQVWYCAEDACWAFGRWTSQIGPMRDGVMLGRTFDWWYTAADDGFDRATLTVIGNVREHPERLTSHPFIS